MQTTPALLPDQTVAAANCGSVADTLTKLVNAPFTLPGRGAAVLLVHGLGGGPYELQWLGDALHARLGFTVRALQLPGHTQAAFRMPHSTWQEWLGAVEEGHAQLQREAGDVSVHVVGFSTGCLSAARLAETRALSGRLVLLAPFVHVYKPSWLGVPPEVLLKRFQWLGWVPSAPTPLRDRALRREVDPCKPFTLFSLKATVSAKALCALVMPELARIAAPTLVLQGARDTVVDPRGAPELLAGLGCERRLRVLERSDHLLAIDEEREAVFDEVCRFLAPRSPEQGDAW